MEPKAAASLTAGLLARKGAARPAMRRQTVTGLGATLGPRAMSSLDDLGWNDMGEDVEAPVPAKPSPVAQHIAAIQETLSRREEERAQAAAAPAPVAAPRLTPEPRKAKKVKAPTIAIVPAPKTRKAASVERRSAAFTLRIDAERHLRLRLLSAVTNQSAQQLLIGALDALISDNPNIDALAADPKLRTGTDN